MSHADCLFCKIAAGTIPSKKVYEDRDFVVFHDIRPAAPVHLLVIPRDHIESLQACRPDHAELLGKMMVLIPKLATEAGVGYSGGETGFRTVFNTGPGGGQEVYHLHAHILGGARPWERMG